MWPFGKKSNDTSSAEKPAVDHENTSVNQASADDQQKDAPSVSSAPFSITRSDGSGTGDLPRTQPSGGGPFDISDATPEEFDFHDFAKANLNLGSVLLPIPHEGDVQVEMGPQGPTMLHVVTPHGRLTPVAFAAPTSGQQWEDSAADIKKGLASDGLEVTEEQGPWGTEIIGRNGDMQMRILGSDGYRWMLRITATGPVSSSAELAAVARGVMARSFVSRGENPIPAGQPLPVTLPGEMAEELRNLYQAQLKEQQEAAAADGDNANTEQK